MRGHVDASAGEKSSKTSADELVECRHFYEKMIRVSFQSSAVMGDLFLGYIFMKLKFKQLSISPAFICILKPTAEATTANTTRNLSIILVNSR